MAKMITEATVEETLKLVGTVIIRNKDPAPRFPNSAQMSNETM